jgi:hypothetical protein
VYYRSEEYSWQPGLITVGRAVDLGGGSEEVERSVILNNWGNGTI